MIAEYVLVEVEASEARAMYVIPEETLQDVMWEIAEEREKRGDPISASELRRRVERIEELAKPIMSPANMVIVSGVVWNVLREIDEMARKGSP